MKVDLPGLPVDVHQGESVAGVEGRRHPRLRPNDNRAGGLRSVRERILHDAVGNPASGLTAERCHEIAQRRIGTSSRQPPGARMRRMPDTSTIQLISAALGGGAVSGLIAAFVALRIKRLEIASEDCTLRRKPSGGLRHVLQRPAGGLLVRHARGSPEADPPPRGRGRSDLE